MVASRAAYIGGCAATSNVAAGQRYGIPVRGTHAHSWVMSFGSELEAFQRYAEVMPRNCIFLVDTFDTLQGVEHAIQVARQLRSRGCQLVGIRLDSGNLAALSKQARAMLDEAQLDDALIVASSDLDEYAVEQLKLDGAQIDVWGIGTRLVTAYDQPALGGVYKLSALQDETGNWQRRVKLSEQPIKVSNPGKLQVRRFRQQGHCVADIIYDEWFGLETPTGIELETRQRFEVADAAEGEDLLVPILRRGRIVYPFPTIDELRERVWRQWGEFPQQAASPTCSARYRVGLEDRLYRCKCDLMRAVGDDES